MSLVFYDEEENNEKEVSIDYKDMFIEYEKNKQTLSEALTQMFKSSDVQEKSNRRISKRYIIKM